MAATGARMAKSRTASLRKQRADASETREQVLIRRFAEQLAQKEWNLIQAGRMLHDDLGQVLTASGIQFDLLAQEAARKYPELAARLSELQHLLEECQVRTRVISQQLNRSTVDRVGLKSALERLCDRWEPGFAGELSVNCPATVRPQPGASRAIAALAEFALELACNRMSCSGFRLEVEQRGSGYFVEIVLENLDDPMLTVDEEIRWHAAKGTCSLAGGDARMDLAVRGRKGTILAAQFA